MTWENGRTVRQIPAATESAIGGCGVFCTCSSCRQSLFKTASVSLGTIDNGGCDAVEVQTLYCTRCKLPFLTKSLAEAFARRHNGAWPKSFYSSQPAAETRQMMDQPVLPAASVPYSHIADRLNPRPADGITQVEVLRETFLKCPVCGADLCCGAVEGPKFRLAGQVCSRCGIIFIRDLPQFELPLKDHAGRMLHVGIFENDRLIASSVPVQERTADLGGSFFVELAAANTSKMLENLDPSDELYRNASIIIKVIYTDIYEPNTYYIVDKLEKIAVYEKSAKAYFYRSEEARELMTAVFVPSRENSGTIRGMPYIITGVIYPSNSDCNFKESFSPDIIYLESGGGYSSSKQRNCSIVDILLYTEKTDCLQVLHSSYNWNENYFFVDPQLFRDFVYNYGTPSAQIFAKFRTSSKSIFDSSSLNDESILKLFGYTVNMDDDLGSLARQDILADLVDMNVITIERIVHHLKFFISTHQSDTKYTVACVKWSDDLEFIKTYKYNPDRFVIAGTSSKIVRRR